VDSDGNAIANTYTLNLPYGSGLVANGTGVLLNNELDDFAAKAGAANYFGLTGGDANAPESTKRPLSSMSPTLVFKDGKLFMATGSPGGSRIITTVLQIIVNVIDHGLNVAEAENAPRAHDQLYPDELRIERGMSPGTIRVLEAMGCKVVLREAMGSANTIVRAPDGELTVRPICGSGERLRSAIDPISRGRWAQPESALCRPPRPSEGDYTAHAKLALCFGSEATGISNRAVERSEMCVCIPMFGMIESLNLGTSSGIVLYEVTRQRREYQSKYRWRDRRGSAPPPCRPR
jgi:hypothetical protein